MFIEHRSHSHRVRYIQMKVIRRGKMILRKCWQVSIVNLAFGLSVFVIGNYSPRTNALARSSQGIPTSCGNTTAILKAANQDAGDGLLIVIARLGETEKRRNLSHRRLHNVRAYLSEYLTENIGRRKPETIILGEGETVSGYGRIELYVEGKLFDILKVKHNADLIVGKCVPEPEDEPCPPEVRNLYPCRDKYKKHRR